MEGRLRKGEGKKVDKVVREERREVLDTSIEGKRRSVVPSD